MSDNIVLHLVKNRKKTQLYTNINRGYGEGRTPEGMLEECDFKNMSLYEKTIPTNIKSSSEHKKNRKGKRWNRIEHLGDEDNLINYQLVISYGLLIKILTNQQTVDKTIVLSTN